MISVDHIFQCWDYFKRGKRKRKDVQLFERHLEDQIFALHEDLRELRYEHGSYHSFHVFDPKERHISGACVRDRLVHQMVYSVLTEVFDKRFIFHSLSSRLGKGTHLGIFHLDRMIGKVSRNGKHPCFAMKMDIRRFFDNIDHAILKNLLRKVVHDEKVLTIIDVIIDSFAVRKTSSGSLGVPLGNVTSQLFANVYLHELDDFIKQDLRERFYLRYCDDFIILSQSEDHLRSRLILIESFLRKRLHLELHPKKIVISKLSQGIDFVGYVLFSQYRRLRATTRRRLKRRLHEAYEDYREEKVTAEAMNQKLQSYLGILSHANEHTLSEALKNAYATQAKKELPEEA